MDDPIIYSEAGIGIDANADVAGAKEAFAWVIDGATGLTDRKFTTGESDAQWFAQTVDNYLQSLIENNEYDDIVSPLQDAVSKTQNDFSDFNPPNDIKLHEYPSAAIAMVKIDDDKINYLILGDCSVIIKDERNVTEFIDTTVPKLDKKVADRMYKLQTEEGLERKEVWDDDEVKRMLRDHRKRFNRMRGYKILSMNPGIIEDAMRGSYYINSSVDLLLTSDGFTSAIHFMDVFDNFEECMDHIKENGVKGAVQTLREKEKKDAECLECPRLKRSDDIALLYMPDIEEGVKTKQNLTSIVDQYQNKSEDNE